MAMCPESAADIVVEEGVFIGVGARIANESADVLTIGAGATIGAGPVVTRSVAPGLKLAGNPAQELRSLAATRRREPGLSGHGSGVPRILALRGAVAAISDDDRHEPLVHQPGRVGERAGSPVWRSARREIGEGDHRSERDRVH